MWKANRTGIIILLAGLALLRAAHHHIALNDEKLADQVLALGFCLLLFGVALASWLSVKKPGGDGES